MKAQIPEQIDSVQALRGIAAIAVVLHHIAALGTNSIWAVDLFFIISGFLMCYVTSGSHSHFLLKRVIRIVPLYWAGTIGVFLVALVLPELLNRSTAGFEALLLSLFFIPFDKGGGVIQPLLFLGWTINYEIFFYLLFALSMAVSQAYRGWICSALLLALVAAGAFRSFGSVVLDFYTDSILINFVVGMGCYGLYAASAQWRMSTDSLAARKALTTLGTLILAALPFGVAGLAEYGNVLMQRVPAAICFVCLIVGLSGRSMPRLLVVLGDSSYSLYLFHPYVVFAFDRVLGAFDGGLGPRTYVMSAVTVLVCCFLAIQSYRHLEGPMTRRLREWVIGSAGARRVGL